MRVRQTCRERGSAGLATTPSEAFWPSECVAWNCEPELTSLLGRQPPPKAWRLLEPTP